MFYTIEERKTDDIPKHIYKF